LWFFTSPQKSAETAVSLKVLPQGAFRQKGWGFPIAGENFDKVPLMRRLRLFYHGQPVRTMAISPDGSHVAATSDMELTKIWNIDSGKVVKSMPAGVLAFSPDSSLLASSAPGEAAANIELWDFRKGEKVRLFEGGHFLGVSTLAFSPDGKRLVSGGRDGLITVWNVETREQEVIETRDE
jgi:WD40 repeat protein